MEALAKKFVEKYNVPEVVLKAIKGEEVTLEEGVEVDSFIESTLTGYETERLDFIKTKYKEDWIKDDLKKKAEELYPATVNPINNKIIKLFDVEKEEGDDPKVLIDKAYEAVQAKLAAAATAVNPDTAEMQSQMNEYVSQITTLTNKVTEVEDEYKVKMAEAISQERQRANQIMTQKLYSEDSRLIEDKLIAKNLALPLKLEMERRGYFLKTVAPEDGSTPFLKVVDVNGTDALNLAKDKKCEGVNALQLEIAEEMNWIRKNNNDQRTQEEMARDAKTGSSGVKAMEAFLNQK